MNLSAIAIKAAKQSEFFLKNNSPAILTGLGVAGFIASTALTIKATVKAEDVLPEIHVNISRVKETEVSEEFSEHDKMTQLVMVYARSAKTLGKIYAPAFVAGSASIMCVLSAHNIMAKRQASLVAAYAALDAGYKAYRKRVAEKIGENEELELYRGVRPKLRALDETEESFDPNKACDDVMPSPYAKFFDEYSRNWTKTPEYNLLFLRGQQDWANDRLRAYGYIFLNEVYEALGLDRTQAGQIVGWKLNGNGDGFVDFGLYAIGDDGNRAFVNCIEPSVLLDFNVDGPIRI